MISYLGKGLVFDSLPPLILFLQFIMIMNVNYAAKMGAPYGFRWTSYSTYMRIYIRGQMNIAHFQAFSNL